MPNARNIRSYAEDYQDAVARVSREIDLTAVLRDGYPTKVQRTDYKAHFGELVRVDTLLGSLTVTLPAGAPSRIGQAIAIANLDSGTNAITIRASGGTINGNASLTVRGSYAIRRAVYMGADRDNNHRWILSAVQQGTSTQPGVQPFFEWNGTDLTQFGSLVQGTNNSQTASVVSSLGLNWISISGNATGNPGNETPALSFLPILSAPPSSGYLVRVDAVPVVLSSSQCVMGIGLRAAERTGKMSDMYGFYSVTTSQCQLVEITNESKTVYHTLTTGETFAANDAITIWFAVEGESLLQGQFIKQFGQRDTSGTHTSSASGCCGLIGGGNNSGTNSYTVYYRNLRCYEWPNPGLLY